MPVHSLFDAPPNNLRWDDVQAFLEQRLAENERIDYKAQLTPDVPESIAAMVNARGGIVIVGVEEDDSKKPVLPPKGISLAHIHGGTLANFCHARLQPLFVPPHAFISFPDSPQRGLLIIQVRPDIAPVPLWEVNKGVLVRVADQNRPADLVTLQRLLGTADDRLRPLRDAASRDIGLALQSNAEDRTYIVVGSMVQRTQPSDRWTTAESIALSGAIYTSVSSRRVDVGYSAGTVLAESKDTAQESFIRISLSAAGVAVFVLGWREDPFPVSAAIAGLLAGVRMLLSKEFVRAYDPVSLMEVTLGLVNWPASGLTSGALWGLGKARPIGPLKGRRVHRRFSLSPETKPWAIVGPFLA